MKKLIFTISALILIITACTERIDIKLDETYTRLVVYGAITTDSVQHIIQLSKTTSYYYNEAPPPVTGAHVEISDDQGNSVTLAETEPGKYATPSDFAAVPGHTYYLDVDLAEEIGGHTHYSASSLTNPIYPIDSIGLVYHPDWGDKGFYEVTCYYQDPPSTDYYMFNIYKNGVWLTDTISNRFVIDDKFYNGNYTNGIGVGYLNQAYEREILHPGDTITFQGCNITQDYYNFVVTLQSEAGFQTPLFSGPPANVVGNVNNGAVGFFASYAVAYARKVYEP